MTVLRELWYCHVAVLSFHASSSSNPPRFPCAYPFLSDFRGQFWRSSGTQNGSCGISSESSRRPLSNDIKFARIGVRTRELWLPEVGVSELFLCTLPMQIPVKRGNAIGEPRVPRRSRSHYLSNAPGLADQLVASRKDSAREGGSCAAYFCKVPDSRESELGLVRYGPASRVHRGVFGPFEGSFPIGIPADPDKFLAIREFHVVHGCVLFPMCPGSQINLLRVRKTLCASVATSVRKIPELSAKPYFVGLFSRAWPCTEASLGSRRYDLANGGRRNVPYAKGTLIDDQSSPTRPIAANRVISTVWNLSPNKLRSDLTWGLPKLQIGWFQRFGISVQTRLRGDLTWGTTQAANRERIGLVHPGLETKFVIRVRIGLVHPALETETNWERIGLGPSRSRNEICDSGPNRSGPPSPRNGDELGTNRPGPPRSRNEICDSGPNRSGPPSPRNGDELGTNRPSPSRSRNEICDSGPNRSGPPSPRNGDELGTNRPGPPSGSGGHRRSDRLAKGKAVAYAPESSPDTDDEYDAMEDCWLGLLLDLESSLVVVLGPSETTRPSPQPGVTTGPSDAPSAAPRRPHTRSTDILPMVAFDRVIPVAVEISDTPLLTNLLAHPSSLVRRCQVLSYFHMSLPDSAGRGGWSDFGRLLAVSRPEYREFLIELGFGPFLSIPYVSVYHPAVWCFIERFFHHTGTFHLSTCEMAVLPVDWSAILGIRFGGRAPPSEPIDGFEAREILGLADRDAIEGVRRPSVRIRHLADVLRRDREEPPTELRYRQWAAYFIFSCFLGNDRSIVPTPIVGMFRDIDTLREYDWGALTYGFYIRGLRRYSRRESISFLGFWQFTVFWAFEHFPTFAPSRLPLASDPDFPLARRWDSSRIERMTTRTLLELRMTVDCIRDADIIFQPYSASLSQRPEVFRAVALSRLRLWIRTPRSWELLLGERTVRQLGVSAYPSLVREGVPYQEWFEQVSLGSLMSLHEVEGGRVMGGVAMDSHHIRSSGQIERLEGEILRLQLELSVSVDRHTADMDRVQGEMAKVARLAAAVRRLEEQLHGMGITPVTGADPSGLGQPSSSPPRDPVSRDWFFDDPPSL
uniref:Aminotransferase-like plant mobile domain-containing protein n=1 Tax=Fagus sylvatica TaxID=28930 RepID=A0A2N9I1J5_FAGSY